MGGGVKWMMSFLKGVGEAGTVWRLWCTDTMLDGPWPEW